MYNQSRSGYGTSQEQKLFRVCFFNARSIVSKLSEFYHLLYNSDNIVDCFCITESWLTNSITDGILDPHKQFSVFRADRLRSKGGGVCVLINSTFKVSRIDLNNIPAEADVLGVDIFFDRCYRLFAVYNPPASSLYSCDNDQLTVMSQLTACLEKASNRKGPTIILGDFNCPNIDWQSLSTPSSQVNLCLFDFVMCNGFVQSVKEPTRGDNTLDLFLINEPFLVSRVDVGMPFSTSDHNMVNVDIVYEAQATSPQQRSAVKQYNWKLGDYASMGRYLVSYDWSGLLSTNLTVDSQWNAFRTVLDSAIDIFVPFKLVHKGLSTRRSHTVKYPRHIRALCQRKQWLWRLHRRQPTNRHVLDRYHQTAADYKSAVFNYEVSVEKRVINSNNTGTLYKFINNRLGRSHDIGILETDEGDYVSSPAEKAKLFNSYFSSVNTVDNGTCPQFERRISHDSELDVVYFKPEALLKIGKKLKPKLSADPDGYCYYLLKQVLPALAVPIGLLFDSFMSVGKVPVDWKTAIITPLYKKGASSQLSNYRPVSITSIFSKLMERVVAQAIIDFLMQHHLISKHQHGFLSKRSTVTNLLQSLKDWTLSIDNKMQQRVAYIDFAKAFDSVCHSKLLIKLSAYGISGVLHQWIADFLRDRSCKTRVGTDISSSLPILSGVVQGSCLGPVLFIIFINDIVDIFPAGTCIKLYADDVKLYSQLQTDPVVLQECLQKLDKWSKIWQLPISYSKCNVFNIGNTSDYIFNIDNYFIDNVKEVVDLGVRMDGSLKFSNHIVHLAAKGHRVANLILKCFRSRDEVSLVRAFVTYVRPILEYGSVTWNPMLTKNIELIERVQRRFTKRVVKLKSLTYCQRLSRLNLESLELRRIRCDLIYTYKLLFGLTDLEPTEFFQLRTGTASRGHPYKLLVQCCRTNIRHNFFTHRVVKIWNSLSEQEVDFSSLRKFKSGLNSKILSRYCKVFFF